MTRHYLTVLIAGLLAGLAMIAFARRTPAPERPDVEAVTSVVPLTVRILEGSVEVSDSVLAQGTRVHLTVENASHAAVTLALGGYEDRVLIPSLAPGGSDTVSFVTDRPGERFPWLRDGVPAARLEVSGSHLIEDHR